MTIWSNVARVDVREALLRPDLVSLGERSSCWYAQLPRALASGEPVPASGRWALDPSGGPGERARGLAPASTHDPLVRGLLSLYERERERARHAAPHDPNFTAPLEVRWQRLTPDEASARPFAGSYCLLLADSGALGPGHESFALGADEIADSPVALPAAPSDHALLTVLRAYGARQASNHQVLRAIMEHPSWLAPVWAVVADGAKEAVVPKMVLYGQEVRMPARVLWVFSDRARADSANATLNAQGGQLGPYVEGVPGAALFAKVGDAAFDKMNVNIGSARVEETFFVGDQPGPLLALWARAVGAEMTLAAARDPGEPAALRGLRELPALSAFQSPGEGLLQIEHDGRRGIPVFTAIDCAEAFEATLGPGVRGEYRRVSAGGAAVLKVLASVAPDAVFVNPAGPGVRRTIDGRAVAAAVSAG